MTIFDLQSHTATAVRACPADTVIALGCFDGVHLGHTALLRTAIQNAIQSNAAASVWTFFEHPFKKGEVLASFSDKLALFRKYGIKYAFFTDFDEVKALDPSNFVREILMGNCRAVGAVCGFNYHFGKNAVGNSDTLLTLMHENGHNAWVVDAVCYNGMPISSTRIRACLASGNTEDAAEMLGRYYSLSLPVLHGKALGRTLNVPTINQEIPDDMQSPLHGTYATMTKIDGVFYPSVTNIGTRPSIVEGDDHRVNAETHIIGYDGWLYGTTVRVYYRHRLRSETKFATMDALKEQIRKDCAASVQAFREDKERY